MLLTGDAASQVKLYWCKSTCFTSTKVQIRFEHCQVNLSLLENPTRLCVWNEMHIYVSSYCYVCVLILLCVHIRLYMCPYTTIHVLILLHVCPHTTICVSSYYYTCVLILLYQFALDNNIPFLFSTQGPLKNVGPPKPANKNQVLVAGCWGVRSSLLRY